jgi:two-component system sensor histidine kinase PilS (NtrC family)
MSLPVTFWRNTAAKMTGAWEPEPAQGSFGRLWLVFMNARVAIAAVLVILQLALQALGNTLNHWTLAVCIAYLCATLAVRLWALPRPPRSTFDAQWIFTIGVDVIAFSLLNFLQPSGINYTPLFALPVLLASVLGPILLAFGTAASVTLLLLADASWSSLQGAGDFTARFLQAGLSGSGFFLVALLANQLALRLAREEKLLKKSQSAARMQIQVNELVIATLADGVLVMDVNGIVRSANPAARRLLAAQDTAYQAPFRLAAQAAWQPLNELMQRTFTLQCSQEANINLVHPGLNARRLHIYARLTASQDDLHESLCVMFLEDLREIEARVRIEKLAAMGRMSAAVAHEIRNPLAAISQANALLEEDLQDASQRQLTGMIGQNARRLAKIVDEVLDISRVQQQIPAPQTPTLLLDESVQRIATDWARQNAVSGRLRVSTSAHNMAVCFDDEHLRRLMINLLDNALRYASGSDHALEITTQLVAPGQARLAVWSDGQPLEETVQKHLFEPFFSSESRSSGLGLYICRELCERYGALIGYQRVLREDTQGNEFFILFRPASQLLSPDLPYLDSVLV